MKCSHLGNSAIITIRPANRNRGPTVFLAHDDLDYNEVGDVVDNDDDAHGGCGIILTLELVGDLGLHLLLSSQCSLLMHSVFCILFCNFFSVVCILCFVLHF